MRTRHILLSDVCKIVGGGTPSRHVAEYYGGNIPWVTPKDMKTWEIEGALVKISDAGLYNSATRLVPRNSVLVVVRSGVLKHTVPVAINRVPVAINQDMKALLCSDGADPDYVARFVKARSSEILQWVRATTADNFPIDKLKQLKIPLPPLPEQQRIAEILDQADALRVKRRGALAKLDSLSQAIFLDMFGDPAANPKGWPKATLGDVVSFVGGGTPSRARPEFFEGTICWATSKDMKCDSLDDTQEHVTTEAIQQSATKLVPPGTILIVVKSKILAHSLPIAITRVPTCFGQDLKGMLVSERVDVWFVTTALRLGKRWLLERARGINTEGLTLDHLRAFPLPLPPISLQRDFAARVNSVEVLKAAQGASLAQLDALFASLQQRAFRGEL